MASFCKLVSIAIILSLARSHPGGAKFHKHANKVRAILFKDRLLKFGFDEG